MASFIQGTQLRTLILGRTASKATGTLSGTTFNLFTIAGGEVLITSLYFKVTTSITTDGGTLAIESVQTTGGTQVIVTATDLGTTDTVAGAVVGIGVGAAGASPAAPKFLIGGTAIINAVVSTGIVKALGASSVNGAGTVYVTWIPLSDGATLS